MNKLVNRLGRLLTKEAPEAAKPKKPPVSEISISLLQRLQEIARHGYQHIAIYGDADFYAQATETLKGSWVSDTWEDRDNGALLANEIALKDYDCLLVGGSSNVAGRYIHVLNLMRQHDVILPVLWVGDRFEFAGGNLCVPGEAVDADIYVFNHFEAYFGIRDPLLATLRVSDAGTEKVMHLLFEPGQSRRFKLSELLPDREGPAVFQIYTQHPRLSGGRHYRWRVFADVHFKDSFTSLHGTHWFEPPAPTTSRFDANLLPQGKVIVSHCSYQGEADTVSGESSPPTHYKLNPPLQISDMILEATSHDGSGFLHYTLEKAHKGLFCFLTEPLENQRTNVMANHLVQVPAIEDKETALADTAMLEKIRKLNQDDWLLTPYPIPVLPKDHPLEFGIAVGNTNPLTLSYTFYLFDETGRLLGDASHTYATPGVYYTPSILALFPEEKRHCANLIVAVPDWEAMGLSPKKVRGQPDLLVRNKQSGDRDLTEFQSCWRNLGIKMTDFPHWIMPQKAVTSGSRLWGRMLSRDGYRTAFTVVYGSGNKNRSGKAAFKFRLYSPGGREQVFYAEIPAFGSKTLWLDECFTDLASFLPEGWGTVLIESTDADLNVQAVTVKGETVSLQHLWGY